MEITTPQGITVAALTLLFVAGMVPMGAIGAQAADGCLDNDILTGKISVSNPLVGQTSASELAYFMANGDDGALERTNGVDAYIVDLGCENHDLFYSLERSDDNGEIYEFNVRFFDEGLNQVGDEDGKANEDIIEAKAPDGSRYAVIELEQGPMINSFRASHGIGFYALSFQMTTMR